MKVHTAKGGKPYIKTKKGARFVSEKKAKAAGWRPPSKASSKKKSSARSRR